MLGRGLGTSLGEQVVNNTFVNVAVCLWVLLKKRRTGRNREQKNVAYVYGSMIGNRPNEATKLGRNTQ